ncbi:putative helicase [Candidatus Magnetobacterium bavaricum]|uniref:Putative helicase n=1 Tax=Candidatus Magnetobacterium bavaricum TaxID=29290 RepID=A0A0F3GU51_9BACT|nr:putative helicase [Candidatus Magnetobacterium bavaricum]
MPGIVKVGMTTRMPNSRKDDLFTTGVPKPFELEALFLFENMAEAEKRAHQALGKYHYGKEFFKVDVATAVKAIEGGDIPFVRL